MNEQDKEFALKASNPKTGWLDRQKFADLIRADERENFVAFIQEYPHWLGDNAKQEIIAAIRARGEQ